MSGDQVAPQGRGQCERRFQVQGVASPQGSQRGLLQGFLREIEIQRVAILSDDAQTDPVDGQTVAQIKSAGQLRNLEAHLFSAPLKSQKLTLVCDYACKHQKYPSIRMSSCIRNSRICLRP